jgi:hypothetical protein
MERNVKISEGIESKVESFASLLGVSVEQILVILIKKGLSSKEAQRWGIMLSLLEDDANA